jgi:hypothetical protein
MMVIVAGDLPMALRGGKDGCSAAGLALQRGFWGYLFLTHQVLQHR